MKQKNKILVLIVAFVTSFSCIVNAQAYANKYYLSFWGAAGYANLLHEKIAIGEERLVKPIGGPGALLGMGFEYHHRRFMMTLGAEFDIKQSYHKFIPFLAEVGTIVDANGLPILFKDINDLPIGTNPVLQSGTGMVDTDGEQFAMQYDFKSYQDAYTIGYLNIPLLMGAKFSNGIYFFMGGKFGLNLIGKARTKAEYMTRGLYPQYMEPIVQMGNHYYNDYESGSSNDVNLNFNVIASFEIGQIRFFHRKKTRWHYRIAGFIDYSVGSYFGMNPLPGAGENVLTNVVSNGEFIGVPGVNVFNPEITDVSLIQNNSVLTSQQAIDKKLNPFLVGVKVTFLFDLGNKEPCNCLDDWGSKWQKRNRIK